jgi:hypothetical protein
MFLDFFYSFLKRAPNSNISVSQLAFPEYNKIYLSVIAFIIFALHEIKQRKFFLGHPVYTRSYYRKASAALYILYMLPKFC